MEQSENTKVYRFDYNEFANRNKRIIKNCIILLITTAVICIVFMIVWYIKDMPKYSFIDFILCFIFFSAYAIIIIVKLKRTDIKANFSKHKVIIKRDSSYNIQSFSVDCIIKTYDTHYKVLKVSDLVHRKNKLIIQGYIEAITRYEDDMLTDELEYKKKLKLSLDYEDMDEIYRVLEKMKEQIISDI